MHRLVVASLTAAGLSVGLTATASAADLGRPAPAPVYTKAPLMVPYSWTGFYVGGNVGWIHSNTNMSSAPDDPATTAFNAACITAAACPQNYGSSKGNGVIGGAQIGYNWQIQSFLVGLETDFQGTSAKPSTTASTSVLGFVPFSGSNETDERWLGTVRGRAGFLATPMLLAYATGGFAYGSVERSWSGSFPTFPSAWSGTSSDKILTGWTVGGGLEWALGNHFTIGAEYLFVKLQGGDTFLTTNQSGGCVPGPKCTFLVTGADVNDNIIRAKLNYKF